MKRTAALVLACSLCAAASAKSAPTEAELHAAHDALFAAYLPVDDFGHDSDTTALLVSARDSMWNDLHARQQFRALLAPLTHPAQIAQACNLHAMSASETLQSMDLEGRLDFIRSLASCSGPLRQLPLRLRALYITQAYEALQEKLAGVKVPVFDQAYALQHTPQLPPNCLHFDAGSNTITCNGKPFDAVIVGSGPAGSVLAHELRRGGRHVLLIDKGPMIIPGAVETRTADGLIDTQTTATGSVVVKSARAIGGGTTVNVDLAFAPTSREVTQTFNRWRTGGAIGKDQFTKDQVAAAYAWVQHSIGTRTTTSAEINRNNAVLFNGAKKAGLHPSLYALNTYAPATSPSKLTDKRSAESELLLPAMQDSADPLSLLANTDARKVLFHDEAAYGVEIHTTAGAYGPFEINTAAQNKVPTGITANVLANDVIISAGSVGSPTLLLRSQVRNDNIGRGVILHPAMPIVGKFDHTIDALEGTQATVYVADHLADKGNAMEAMAAQPLYLGLMFTNRPRETYEMVRSFRHLAGFGVMLIDSVSPENRVFLDDDGNPQINYTLSQQDAGRLRDSIAEAVRIMFLAGAKEVYLPTTEDGVGAHQSNASAVFRNSGEADSILQQLKFVPGETVLTSAHIQATNKMGGDPATSVVAQDFHVWNTRHLYVVDGSVFPTSIGVNPMQSIYTIAKIFADTWRPQQEKH